MSALSDSGWPACDQDAVIDPTVSCDRCDACCCRKEVLLLDDHALPHHWVVCVEGGGEALERLEDGWCAALDRQQLRCSIYARRPAVCRAVTMGGAECLEARAQTPVALESVSSAEASGAAAPSADADLQRTPQAKRKRRRSVR